MDQVRHRRFLDYFDRFEYFGRGKKKLTADEFEKLDIEYLALLTKARDDEEEARFAEVASALLRD